MSEVITTQPTSKETSKLYIEAEGTPPEKADHEQVKEPLTETNMAVEDTKNEEKIITYSDVSNETDCCCYLANDDPLAAFYLCRVISNFFVNCGYCTEVCCERCFLCVFDCECPDICCGGNCRCGDSGHCFCCEGDCSNCDCVDCMNCVCGCTDSWMCCNFFGGMVR